MLKRLILLLILGAMGWGQSTTPNLNMSWPAHGATNWDTQTVNNSLIIDNIFAIPSCGDAQHAVGWNFATRQLTCQLIPGAGGGAFVLLAPGSDQTITGGFSLINDRGMFLAKNTAATPATSSLGLLVEGAGRGKLLFTGSTTSNVFFDVDGGLVFNPAAASASKITFNNAGVLYAGSSVSFPTGASCAFAPHGSCSAVYQQPVFLAGNTSGGTILYSQDVAGSTAIGFPALSGTAITDTTANFKTNPLESEFTNAAAGTATGSLVKLIDTAGTMQVTKTATTDTNNAYGCVQSGAGTSGTAQVAWSGTAQCLFDNVAVTDADFVIVSVNTVGTLSDSGSGSTIPTGVLNMGKARGSHAPCGAAPCGPYSVVLQTPDALGAAGTGIVATPNVTQTIQPSTDVTGLIVKQFNGTNTADVFSVQDKSANKQIRVTSTGFQDCGGQVFNVKCYGAVGGGTPVSHSDGSVTSGTTAFTSATANFQTTDVGKNIFISGAGPTAPSTNGASTAASGGQIPCATTVFYKISYLVPNSQGFSESAGSTESSQATAACGGNANTVTINAPTAGSQGATGYVVYASTTTGQEIYQEDTGCASQVGIGCAIGTNWTLTRVGIVGPSPLTASTSTFETTIAARVSATAVTLNNAALSTVSGAANYWYGVDDTAGIQAAINACNVTAGGTIEFPTGSYLTSSPVIWQGGCRLDSTGSKGIPAGTLPTIGYYGRLGGIQFLSPHGQGVFYAGVQNLIFGSNSPLFVGNIFWITDRADWGVTFHHFQFNNTVGDGIVLNRGATNWGMHDFRTDSLMGGYILHDTSQGSTIWMHDFTADNQNHGQAVAQQFGLIAQDQTIDSCGSVSISMQNGHIEDNSGYGGTHPAVIYLKSTAACSAPIAYVGIADTWVPSTGVNAFNMVYEDTTNTFDPTLVNWRNVYVSSWPTGGGMLGGFKNTMPALNLSYPNGTFGGSNTLCCSTPDQPFNSLAMVNEMPKINGDAQGNTFALRLPDANRIRFYNNANNFTMGFFNTTTTFKLMQFSPGSIQWNNNGTTATVTLPATPAQNDTYTFQDANGTVPLTIASGTSTLTSGSVTTNTCQTAVTTAATNAATTDAIAWDYATAPGTADALMHVSAYPTAGNVNFTRCNATNASQTGTAIVVNWRVIR